MLAQNSDALHQVTKYLLRVTLTYFFSVVEHGVTRYCIYSMALKLVGNEERQLLPQLRAWIPHKPTSSQAETEWFQEVNVGSEHMLLTQLWNSHGLL